MANETSTKKHLSATVYYLLSGLILGWPGLAATGHLLPQWREGDLSSALSLAAIHTLVLGSMLTVAFGVLYQIIPIAFQAPPVPRHVLYWHLPLHILSVAAMVVGFLFTRFDVVAIGGAALTISAAGYVSLIARSYRRARNKTPVHKGLVWPIGSLWLVLLVGIFQAAFPGLVSQSVILTHVLLGGLVFWGGLVLVFSYKLVPMFAISHGYKASLPLCSVPYFSGAALFIVSAWLPAGAANTIVTSIASLLILFALVSYTRDMIRIVRARKRRRLVLPLYDAFVSIGLFVAGQAGIIIAIALHQPAWLYPAAYAFGFGGLLGLMFSFMQKMVPFLWFEYRFSKRPERKTAPLIDDMVPKWMARFGIGLYFVGVIVGIVGMASALAGPIAQILAWSSAGCTTAGSILLFASLRHVLTIGGRRPADDEA